jgi:hypothetical protein
MVLKMNRVHLSEALPIEIIVVDGDTKLLEASAHGSCILTCVSDIVKLHRFGGLCRQEKSTNKVAF